MKIPLFSVVIPLYNKSEYIMRTIGSVLGQSFADFEVIVVNDGSTDDGPDKVVSCHDPRIRLIDQQNGGVSLARNRGIKEARGEYIAFLDADDLWQEKKLDANHDFIRDHPGLNWVVSGFARRYKKSVLDVRFSETQLLPDVLAAIASGLLIWTGAVVVRRECFQEDCLFPAGISRSEDREVWLKLACRYPQAGYLGQSLAIYNADTPGSLINTASAELDFSFLYLDRRMEPFLAAIPESRRQMFQNYLINFNRRACLSFTVANRCFFQNAPEETLRKYLTTSQFFCLKSICPWPAGIKRVLSRLMYSVGFFR